MALISLAHSFLISLIPYFRSFSKEMRIFSKENVLGVEICDDKNKFHRNRPMNAKNSMGKRCHNPISVFAY